MKIKGCTRVCTLIGNPVDHSISPLIHNTLADMTGIDMVYTTSKVLSGRVSVAIEGAYELNILGLNVTVPHKQEVIDSLVDIDELAKNIGAVNTLVRVEGGYKGYNTDILGLLRSMKEDDMPISKEKVIILGAGGAARAIAFMCAKEGAKHIYILNRTKSRASDIANAVNSYIGQEIATAMAIEEYTTLEKDERYVCIQTTSVGLHPNDNDVIIEDMEFYKLIKVAVDIIYNPYETRFMKLAKSCNARCANGLKMLLYQGVAAFELWNKVNISDDMCKELYRLMKKEMNIDG